ncbi:MAG: MOSC N-terminal beta barrel domain-containing protein [Myxococcota bacterium]|nr:MOSC N-terminal beta barrel domain-containing protein [Myxococcota bacterium]
MQAFVSALFVYPVKSCGGIALERAVLDACGLSHDRRWMIVDDEGRFVTQRTEPRLALVGVSLTHDALVLTAPRMSALALPLWPQDGPSGRRIRRVVIWRDEVDAFDCGEDAARWASDWLGSRASLVFMPDDVARPVNPKHGRAGDLVSFADAFPVLLASSSSLADLNARMAVPVPMERFRPNIVVSGCPSWAEDTWTRICISDVPLRVVKPCTRCVITTVDQHTADRGVEPLRTLASFRTRENEVLFAQNCIHDGRGTVAVGDLVTVQESR